MTKTEKVLDELRRYESRNITFMERDGSWPVVWKRAEGVHVWDIEGKRYLDLTAAFGVAAAGHGNRKVVAAAKKQMKRLPHAMGDVHPHALKARLCRELSSLTFERWSGGRLTGKTILANSGFEAVEAALKTALLATGKPGVIAFEGAYHGLGYGALNVTERAHFRAPFQSQLARFGHFVPYPATTADLSRLGPALQRVFDRHRIGAVIVEPVQARGGVRVPPFQFLALLRRICDRNDALLICDEIYTGFGRTGKWFACEHSHVVPDLICLGKALTGGFPLSACVGRAKLMDAAWPPSSGEAIHTSTFLGHPVGCAMALAQIAEIRKHKLDRRAGRLGKILLESLGGLSSSAAAPKPFSAQPSAFSLSPGRSASPAPSLSLRARGLGLLAGLELRWKNGTPATALTLRVVKGMLRRGFILLPEGADSNVIGLTPPLIIKAAQLRATLTALAEEIEASLER
jgi:4-aminobutyrate aminotransferase-like enzyme